MLSKEGLYKKNPKYREKVDSIIYNKTLESFDFTLRLHNIFKSNNIITVNDLLKYSPTDFLKFQNSGLKTQKEVLDFLNSHNLSFGDQWEKNSQELDEDEYIEIKDNEIQFLVSSPFQNSFFSTRTINYLKRMKIEYNRDILYLNKENIMLTKNAGRKTYVEIRDFIKKNNFNFGDNIYGWTSENIEKIKEEFNNKIIENYNLRIKENNINKLFYEIIENLSDKEKEILCHRYGINKNKKTLEEISLFYNPKITRERVRQIENKALRKLKIFNEIFYILEYYRIHIFEKLSQNTDFIPGSSIKIDNLEPELLLFFDVHYKNISEYLDLNFNKFDYGWHITSIENDLLNNEIKKIKHCLKKSNNFPYYFNNYYIDNNLHKELLIFYTNHFSNNYIYKNFLLENKNKKNLRTINLYYLFNDKLVTTYDLKKLYKNKYTHDVCSFRDLSIVMAENPKLFISTKNHCWQRIKINNFKNIDIYEFPSYNDEYEVQKSENINESEIVQILTKILIDNGPLRISKIIKEFNKVSNSKFSTSSVSALLFMREDFISYSPGYYGLYEKRNDYLNKINFNDFNDNDIKLFILGKYYDLSSEYMWWNYDLEKYLCKEKRDIDQELYKALLFVSEPNKWNENDLTKNNFLKIKKNQEQFLFFSQNNINIYEKPPKLIWILKILLYLETKNNLNWVIINFIQPASRLEMSTNLGTLVVFALLEIINFSADSNFYDKYSLNNEKIINLKNKLIKNLHKFGELKWSSDFGVQLIEKFNQDIEYPSWIDKLQVKELIKNLPKVDNKVAKGFGVKIVNDVNDDNNIIDDIIEDNLFSEYDL